VSPPNRLVLALLAVTLAQPALAANPAPGDKLKTVEREIDATKKEGETLDRQAKNLTDELSRLQAAAVASAHIAQDNEARLSALEGQLANLSELEAHERGELEARRDHEQKVLAALQRLTLNPPAAVLFQPGSPVDSARGAILLGAAVPPLEAEAKEIATALNNLQRTRSDIAQRRVEMGERQAALDVERQHIAQMMRQKQALEGETREQAQGAQQRLASLTAEAGDLKELLQRIEREHARQLEEDRRRAAEAKARAEREAADRAAKDAEERRVAEAALRDKPSPAPKIAEAVVPAAMPRDLTEPPHKSRQLQPGKAMLQLPVAGNIVKHYGDPEGFSTSKGLTITTRSRASVVAPFDGQIMFAGPFKGYGQILIIDHGGGYHSLLAGIDEVDGVVGQWVVAGEPLGTMQADGQPKLYLELRRQGQPINPLPWLAARDGKVSG
jgi:septal ring factor EnvC (AmiA/AmiB activator)